MERLRRLLSHIGAQMSVLTVSQRVAIGLCAALIAASLLWLVQWSTEPDLVPLVTHEFLYEDLETAEEALKANGVEHVIRGTRIYVQVEQRHNALRLLYSAGALPDGSLFDMAAVVSDENPFQSPQAREYAQNYAKGNELAKIISTYPFVEKSSVLLNPTTKRRLGGTSDIPTASLAVTLRRGQEMTAEKVEGFAKLVAGAVAGLQPHRVNITDSRTGRSYNVPHPDDAVSFDYLAIVKKHEDRLRGKIMDKLADIPGLRATVTVELDTSKRTTQKFEYDDPQPKMESSASTESSTASQPTEPGVQANLGTAVTAGAGERANTSEQTKVENFEPKPRETEVVEQMPFAPKSVTAAVGIPRSFIVSVYKAQQSDAPDPKEDDPEFVAIRDEQMARVKRSVERIVMAKNPQDVQVDVYPDMEWKGEDGMWRQVPGDVATLQAGGEVFDAIHLFRTYGPVVGLGSLALISLLMVSRIVRKSSEMVGAAARSGDSEFDGEGFLNVGPRTIGQAEASEGLLTGQEVDERTLRNQELSGEVAKMIEEDPTVAADLIRRWVEESS